MAAVQIPLRWTLDQMVYDSSTGPTAGAVGQSIADDLAALKPTTAASADASDLATAITLVNELKDINNVNAAITIGTTKAS